MRTTPQMSFLISLLKSEDTPLLCFPGSLP